MNYVFAPQEIPSVAVEGTEDRFPVRRIFCVGRNYAEHAREMGGDPDREPPFFFTKPADAVVESGTDIPYPKATANFHYEMELVVAIGEAGENIEQEDARRHIFGYATGIDLTRRDLQKIAKDKGRPWDSGKAFDQSAPCGTLTPAANAVGLETSKIWLTVNDETRQLASIADLIWSIDDVIAFLSREFMLQPGDLIYTGTPAGVGPLERGDHVKGHIDGLSPIEIKII
ncbi:fumarylacetoacetate hydrolase family protein [Sneathiella sp.]|uniref:fumarylacetoacetate hydrolase family protein n=1 Tax=Sneathiella sp. TaxID=1964365 RepID=UPI0035613EBA